MLFPAGVNEAVIVSPLIRPTITPRAPGGTGGTGGGDDGVEASLQPDAASNVIAPAQKNAERVVIEDRGCGRTCARPCRTYCCT
jgi:hypothetical protein